MFSFLGQTIKQFQMTGAVWPSSPMLARQLCAPLREAVERGAGPLNILEAGPGTGSITEEIVRLMREEDRLVLSELNPHFVQTLRKRLDTDQQWRRHRERIVLIEGPVQALELESAGLTKPFDLVICGLPFTNFPPSLVREIFEKFASLSRPGAPLTWFEYIAVRKLRMALGGKGNRVRLRQVTQVMDDHRRKSPSGGTRCPVLVNMPPAWVHRIELHPVSAQGTGAA
jgi:phospholipid N-methyltransferase